MSKHKHRNSHKKAHHQPRDENGRFRVDKRKFNGKRSRRKHLRGLGEPAKDSGNGWVVPTVLAVGGAAIVYNTLQMEDLQKAYDAGDFFYSVTAIKPKLNLKNVVGQWDEILQFKMDLRFTSYRKSSMKITQPNFKLLLKKGDNEFTEFAYTKPEGLTFEIGKLKETDIKDITLKVPKSVVTNLGNTIGSVILAALLNGSITNDQVGSLFNALKGRLYLQLSFYANGMLVADKEPKPYM